MPKRKHKPVKQSHSLFTYKIEPVKMSFSESNSMDACKLAWRWEKLEKLKGLPSKTLEHGKAVHSEIEEMLTPLLKNSKAELPRNYVTTWLEEEGIEPESLEEELVIVRNNIRVKAVIDMAGSQGDDLWIVDWKSGKNKNIYTDNVRQLQLYAYMYSEVKNRTPDRLAVCKVEARKTHVFDVDLKYGETVFNQLLANGTWKAQKSELIVQVDEYDLATPHKFCYSCAYRDICVLDMFDNEGNKR